MEEVDEKPIIDEKEEKPIIDEKEEKPTLPLDEKKPEILTENKSSMEILSELFGTFDAEPPVIVKKEKDEGSKKHKKSKKKHKHKDKKHKKKSKKKKRTSSESSGSSGNSAVDLSEILVKSEIEDSKSYLSETLRKIIDIESIIKTEKEDGSINVVDTKETTDLLLAKEEVKKDKEDKKKGHKRKKHKHSAEEDEREAKKCKKHNSKDISEKPKKSSTPDRERFRHRSKENRKSRERDRSREDHRHKSLEDHRHKSLDLWDKIKGRHWDEKQSRHSRDEPKRDRDDNRYRDDYRQRNYEEEKRHRYRDNPFYREHPEDRVSKDDRWDIKDKLRPYDRDRVKFRQDAESKNRIDKKKLLEIARRNAIQMMKSGSLRGVLPLGPQAQEKVIAAIRSGGKTVEELTDFCKSLSKKEELGELSSVSEDNSDSDGDQPFHHPFQIKDKPLTINIKNSVPLPIKSNQERASELRIQFPVSSGQQHRKTESEWVPVSPKKIEPAPLPVPKPVPTPVAEPVVPLQQEIPAIPALPPIPVVPGPQAFPPQVDESQENIDIAAIVSQRLTAMRKLQENPHDVQAITQMYKAQKEMNTWAESKQQIGQFTGSTGAQILTQAELSSGQQAWARKNQLRTAAPVTGGMGMHLLQKMGWKPGEGLGKEKNGALEPLLLDVKLDKKGIVAKEEQKKKQAKVQKVKADEKATVKTLQDKHPVSLLGEYASKRKLGAPQYAVDFECGPDHKKNFLFKVVLNGIEYKPNVASGNKKEAKAMAATVCLQQLGLIPA